MEQRDAGMSEPWSLENDGWLSRQKPGEARYVQFRNMLLNHGLGSRPTQQLKKMYQDDPGFLEHVRILEESIRGGAVSVVSNDPHASIQQAEEGTSIA